MEAEDKYILPHILSFYRTLAANAPSWSLLPYSRVALELCPRASVRSHLHGGDEVEVEHLLPTMLTTGRLP